MVDVVEDSDSKKNESVTIVGLTIGSAESVDIEEGGNLVVINFEPDEAIPLPASKRYEIDLMLGLIRSGDTFSTAFSILPVIETAFRHVNKLQNGKTRIAPRDNSRYSK